MKKFIPIFIIALAFTMLNAMEDKTAVENKPKEQSLEKNKWRMLPNHIKWEIIDAVPNYPDLLVVFEKNNLVNDFLYNKAFLKNFVNTIFNNKLGNTQILNELLIEAVEYKNINLVIALINKSIPLKDYFFRTSFNNPDFLKNFAHTIFQNDQRDAINLLIEAAKNKNVNLVKAFIDEDNSLKKYATHLLAFAAFNKFEASGYNEDMFNTLLDAGIDINSRTPQGLTGLMQALLNDDRKKAEWLVEHGANILEQDLDGKSFFDYLDIYLNPRDINKNNFAKYKFWEQLKEKAIEFAKNRKK